MEQCVTALKNHSPESRQNKDRLWEIHDLLCHPNLSCRRKMKDSKKCPDVTRTASLLLCPSDPICGPTLGLVTRTLLVPRL